MPARRTNYDQSSNPPQFAGESLVQPDFVDLQMSLPNTIRARNIGRDIVAVLKNIVGGEIEEYTKLLAESREQSIDRMQSVAEEMGANAVVGIRFSTSEIMNGAAEIMAYGTAVIIE